MSDNRDLAAFYQNHKDDPEEWGDPEPAVRGPRRRLASMISVRFAPEEAEQVRVAAEQSGTSLSNFIREASLAAARRRGVAEVLMDVASSVVVTATGAFAEVTADALEGWTYPARGQSTRSYIAGSVDPLRPVA